MISPLLVRQPLHKLQKVDVCEAHFKLDSQLRRIVSGIPPPAYHHSFKSQKNMKQTQFLTSFNPKPVRVCWPQVDLGQAIPHFRYISLRENNDQVGWLGPGGIMAIR